MLSYTAFHWGTEPLRNQNMQCAAGAARALYELKAVSYAAVKGGKPEVYRHEFERQDGRLPYLLVLDDHGDHRLKACPETSFAIGRALDFETSQGKRIVIGNACFLVSSSSGSHVWIAAHEPIPFGIETRQGSPIVTEHGIEK